jgi:hypothetical protein
MNAVERTIIMARKAPYKALTNSSANPRRSMPWNGLPKIGHSVSSCVLATKASLHVEEDRFTRSS